MYSRENVGTLPSRQTLTKVLTFKPNHSSSLGVPRAKSNIIHSVSSMFVQRTPASRGSSHTLSTGLSADDGSGIRPGDARNDPGIARARI